MLHFFLLFLKASLNALQVLVCLLACLIACWLTCPRTALDSLECLRNSFLSVLEQEHNHTNTQTCISSSRAPVGAKKLQNEGQLGPYFS